MLALIDEHRTIGNLVPDELARRVGDNDLPSVPGVHNASAARDGRAEVIAVDRFCFTGVESDSHLQRRPIPRFGSESRRRTGGCRQSSRPRFERSGEAVPGVLEEMSAGASHMLPEDLVVTGQRAAHARRV
ncbi:MAG TPA: hypothetical protein VK860_14170 [Ilumatobacteraceae bacterium]|nr:hypothetical protein [Ilumatobacteraceae bacterium]